MNSTNNHQHLRHGRRGQTVKKSSLRLLLLTLVASLGLLATSTAAQAQDDARIHLIHGIPGVDVDVEAGGANVIEGFSFGDTEDLSALAGNTLEGLKVKAAGTETVAIDAGDIALPASGNYTVIAHLDGDGTPALGVFQNDVSNTAAGQGRLTVRHAAAAPAVDVLANGSPAIVNLANGAGESLDLGAGTISASVVPTGASEPVVIGPADLTVVEGQSLTVYAVGSLGDNSLTVLTETITGLHSAPTAVNTGNSPVGSSTTGITLALAAGFVVLTMTGGLVTRRQLATVDA